KRKRRSRMLKAGIFILSFFLAFGEGFVAGKRSYQIQNGPCSYTFLLPEQEACPPGSYGNQVQKDDADEYEESLQRLEQLENTIENNTQWLLKLESYIQEKLKQDLVQLQQDTVQHHAAAMIEIGTNILNHTAEQTRKLTHVEVQVINQTTRLERQLLENSKSTNKLEKDMILQTNEITKLNSKNSFLEKRMEDMEGQRQAELKSLQEEKEQLKKLVEKQTDTIEELKQQLQRASEDNLAMEQQQLKLEEMVNNLIQNIKNPTYKSAMMQDMPTLYKDCAAIFKAGNKESGVYTLAIPDTKEQIKAYCDMETEAGGWTIVQKRFSGAVDFDQTWKEYKMGFGDASGEHWLGNEYISKLTNEQQYVLRIELTDWDGNTAFSQYEEFSLSNEEQKYRIHLKGYSGTAGKISSLAQPGSDFSTKDADNDKCVCKCSQLTTGGWWFDACGPSNLNGVYYQQGQHTSRFNGIKWYYWKGSGYSLKATTIMIRPVDF
ncbi:angiopoietin-2 precursor, partial [Silurus meridionalis]